ncbi:hypothetical protein G7046_g4490 [Stylonectria norvegica]|nr:hypothetical protein G7046_g4490 [Stylonectria norvegica]
MFAVPGWSVAADGLKAEKQTLPNPPGTKTRKRKRAGAPPVADKVTASNVADLYETVIEGRKAVAPQSEKAAKRQKKLAAKKAAAKFEASEAEAKSVKEGEETDGEKPDEKDGEEDGESQPKPKKEKKTKRTKSQGDDATTDATAKPAAASKSEAIPKPTTTTPPAPKLTPLQASMREKLVSARFRHLNETLYTRPSKEAYQLFADSPEMFDEYHEGFRRQVKVWPENPVDSFLTDIRARGKVRAPSAKLKPNAAQMPLFKTVLPRTNQECTIADLGCGDARLAEALKPDAKKMRVTVKSFDLQSPSQLVIKADIANLPLPDGSVNVAVFCLALMGTNWVDFVEEAYRILHWKGELWVAEIKSRFGPVRAKNAPVTHSVGNRKKVVAKKGAAAKEDDGAHDEDLAVEVDGMEDRRRETDVSAFIDVLKTRGFVPYGDREAIDLTNKMFVKMRFIKMAQPSKGKGYRPEMMASRGRRPIVRTIDHANEKPEMNEAAVLKPCVYKQR